jgi:hypothetical protein
MNPRPSSPRPSSRGGRPRLTGRPGPSGFVVPFDYAASFKITGEPGNLIQDVITISPDGAFVAVAIGYGFKEERGREVQLDLGAAPGLVQLGDILLRQIPLAALIEGFRIRPGMESLAFDGAELTSQPFAKPVAAELFESVKSPADISFLFSMVDSGSGRELQDEPVHNLASLGKSNGERPFRRLATPLSFMPRSTLRLQVTERSAGIKGDLFIVLFGYKTLAGAACPEPAFRALLEASRGAARVPGAASLAVIPFDYVASFDLTGRAGNRIPEEIAINAEGAFVATAVGYGLATRSDEVRFRYEMDPSLPQKLKLTTIPLRLFPPDALSDGIRLRSAFHRLAFTTGGSLSAANVDRDLLDRAFERIGRPEEVSFEYTVLDTSSGRELQNRPIHNVAGLGIANGDRPFKQLARPLVLLPRSTLRITLVEHFGEGTVYMAFHGYKVLGGARGVSR